MALIHRQFARDDFDENVLAVTETLAVLLQLNPTFISSLDAGTVNLLLRFCANSRNPKSPSEDEAYHNAFNIVSLIGMDLGGNSILFDLKGIEMLLSCWVSSSQSTLLAIRTLDSCLAGSANCCEQFVDGGGLKKLFGAFKLMSSVKYCFPLLGILDSLLTVLPIDSMPFKRLLRKFSENDCEKVPKFLEVCEFVAGQQSETEDEDPAFEVFTKCCSMIAVVFAFSASPVRLALLAGLNQSDAIDAETVIDSAELRSAEIPTLADRINAGISLLRDVSS
jgi:hypothetical protein